MSLNNFKFNKFFLHFLHRGGGVHKSFNRIVPRPVNMGNKEQLNIFKASFMYVNYVAINVLTVYKINLSVLKMDVLLLKIFKFSFSSIALNLERLKKAVDLSIIKFIVREN